MINSGFTLSTSLPCHNFLDRSCQLTSTRRTRGTHKTRTSPVTGKERQTTPAPSHAVMHARIIVEARVEGSVAAICQDPSESPESALWLLLGSRSGSGGSTPLKHTSTSRSYAQAIRVMWIPNRARSSPRVQQS